MNKINLSFTNDSVLKSNKRKPKNNTKIKYQVTQLNNDETIEINIRNKISETNKIINTLSNTFKLQLDSDCQVSTTISGQQLYSIGELSYYHLNILNRFLSNYKFDSYEFNNANSFIKDLVQKTSNTFSNILSFFQQQWSMYIDAIIDKKVIKNLNLVMKHPENINAYSANIAETIHDGITTIWDEVIDEVIRNDKLMVGKTVLNDFKKFSFQLVSTVYNVLVKFRDLYESLPERKKYINATVEVIRTNLNIYGNAIFANEMLNYSNNTFELLIDVMKWNYNLGEKNVMIYKELNYIYIENRYSLGRLCELFFQKEFDDNNEQSIDDLTINQVSQDDMSKKYSYQMEESNETQLRSQSNKSKQYMASRLYSIQSKNKTNKYTNKPIHKSNFSPKILENKFNVLFSGNNLLECKNLLFKSYDVYNNYTNKQKNDIHYKSKLTIKPEMKEESVGLASIGSKSNRSTPNETNASLKLNKSIEFEFLSGNNIVPSMPYSKSINNSYASYTSHEKKDSLNDLSVNFLKNRYDQSDLNSIINRYKSVSKMYEYYTCFVICRLKLIPKAKSISKLSLLKHSMEYNYSDSKNLINQYKENKVQFKSDNSLFSSDYKSEITTPLFNKFDSDKNKISTFSLEELYYAPLNHNEALNNYKDYPKPKTQKIFDNVKIYDSKYNRPQLKPSNTSKSYNLTKEGSKYYLKERIVDMKNISRTTLEQEEQEFDRDVEEHFNNIARDDSFPALIKDASNNQLNQELYSIQDNNVEKESVDKENEAMNKLRRKYNQPVEKTTIQSREYVFKRDSNLSNNVNSRSMMNQRKPVASPGVYNQQRRYHRNISNENTKLKDMNEAEKKMFMQSVLSQSYIDNLSLSHLEEGEAYEANKPTVLEPNLPSFVLKMSNFLKHYRKEKFYKNETTMFVKNLEYIKKMQSNKMNYSKMDRSIQEKYSYINLDSFSKDMHV